MNKSAYISGCSKYRYSLGRDWTTRPDALAGRLCFIMLNPSTADAEFDDPTIRKCIGFAERMGFGSIEVVNLFAWRATDPVELAWVTEPIGPENDMVIKRAVAAAHIVICAWGANKAAADRAARVRNMLREWGVAPMALSITKDGQPGHPLYIPYTAQPVPFPSPCTYPRCDCALAWGGDLPVPATVCPRL